MTPRISTITVGQNRGNSRIWLQGKWLAAYGFAPGGSWEVSYESGLGKITITTPGPRTISGTAKRGAILDICNPQLGTVFSPGTRVRVEATHQLIQITPSRVGARTPRE